MNKAIFFILLILVAFPGVLLADPPASFDLRNVSGYNYVSSVKDQTGGTCWTHGAMAAMEGNLMMTGNWDAAGETGEPNLAEYHLDWWNGFNKHNNDDIDPPTGGGLTVHEGGDYLVTSAYLTRGEGAVRDIDGQSYYTPPARSDPGFHRYYPRDIEWYTAGADLSNINTIKNAIMTYGVLGTCMYYGGGYMVNYVHYQPPETTEDPNHAIAIIGWDDNKVTQAPQPGAWLCKNSWGGDWGESGCFWISYYDKHSCQHPEMGAISFQNVELQVYNKIHYHDYHGWRDEKTDCSEAFNAFVVDGFEILRAVSFFTTTDGVTYTAKIFNRFEGGELLDELSAKTGTIAHTGFHTVDLDAPIEFLPGDDFYIYLELSDGGHAFDRTSEVPVLLGAKYKVLVESASEPGQSYYRSGAEWMDLYDDDNTANFCIKGLAERNPPLNIILPDGVPQYLEPGVPTTVAIEITDQADTYVPGSGLLHYRSMGETFTTIPLVSLGGDLFEATLPAALCGYVPEYYFSAEAEMSGKVYNPSDAPDSVYASYVGEITVLFVDSFETDLGWTAENLGATSGEWERGVPVNDMNWAYDPESDADGSGQCYLTQNDYGNTDIDDGAVRLISSVFSLPEGADIGYDYYLYLTDAGSEVDRLLVEINNDGGVGDWTEIARHEMSGGLVWRHHEITAADLALAGVVPTSSMQIRFTANDAYPQSVVEAGLDCFTVTALVCEEVICGDANDDESVNLGDAVCVINYVFHDGPAPGTVGAGDANCDGNVNMGDAVYLLNYVFHDGPVPCANCP